MAAGRTSRQLEWPGDVASHGPSASPASTHIVHLRATVPHGTTSEPLT